MQNLDFSSRIKKNSPPAGEGAGADLSRESSGGLGGLARLWPAALILILVTFGAGMMAGVRINGDRSPLPGSADSGNKSTLKNKGLTPDHSDSESEATSGRSTVLPRPTSHQETATVPGRVYIILMGAYSPRNAVKLLKKVNSSRELLAIKHGRCKTVVESVPNRKPGFRLAHPSNANLHRVYVGCYDSVNIADAAARVLKGAGLLTADARLFYQ